MSRAPRAAQQSYLHQEEILYNRNRGAEAEDDSSGERAAKANEDSRVLSGGTGEASQETISRHFQKVMGLSPITKLESEDASQFTMINLATLRQDNQTTSTFREEDQTSVKNSNLLQKTNTQNTMVVNSARSTQKHLSRLSDRRTKQNQLESYRSNASGGIMTHMSSHDSPMQSSVMLAPVTMPSMRQVQYTVRTQDSIQEIINDDDEAQAGSKSSTSQNHLLSLENVSVRCSQPVLAERQEGDQQLLHEATPSILTENKETTTDRFDNGADMLTQNGFIRAQTHEKTTDLTMLNKIVYEKKKVNQLVEDELDEFRREIEAKFAVSLSRHYVMPRPYSQANAQEESNNSELDEGTAYKMQRGAADADLADLLLMPEDLGQAGSRITLQHEGENEYAAFAAVQNHESSSSTQISHKSSMVVLHQHNDEEQEGMEDGDARNQQQPQMQGPSLCLDLIAQRTEGMKSRQQSGTLSAGQKSGLLSPVSLNMDLICHQEGDEEEEKDSEHNSSRKKEKQQCMLQKAGKTSKENQLRKFAKQIFNRHLIQAQEFQVVQTADHQQTKNNTMVQQQMMGSALQSLLEGLVKQQKKQGAVSSGKQARTKSSAGKRAQDLKQFKKVHQKSTNLTNNANILLGKITQIDQKRSKSNPRHASAFMSADSQSGGATSTTNKTGGFSTLQDSKNNTLISLAQKRRRAGIATRQEPRSSKSNVVRRESGEKSRSISRATNNAPNKQVAAATVAMSSPVNLKQTEQELMLASMLTKSLGVGPPSAQLNGGNAGSQQASSQAVASSKTRDGLFKILKDFEEQLDTGYQVDRNLNRSVSVKRDRSQGAKSKQSKPQQQSSDLYRASSVPRSHAQKHQQKLKVTSTRAAAKQGSFILISKDTAFDQEQLSHVSPIMQSKSHHGKHHIKKSEIKQLSTASESLLVYDISRPHQTGNHKQQPLTVKNSQSFTSTGGSSKMPQGTNIRVKTPIELVSSSIGKSNNSGGNRANLFNKYLRATDISNQKRISNQKLQSSRSKRKETATGKRQSNRTGDSLGSVRNASLTSQRVHHQPSVNTSLAAGSVNIISGTGVCKNSTTTATSHRSKSNRGTKQNSINDPMRVYQTYIGQTTTRLSGFNKRTKLSRQGGSSMDRGEDQLKTQLSFQKNSVSSNLTNKMTCKPGLKDPKDFQLTINSSTKTPSANVILNGLIMNSKSVQKMSQGPRGHTSQSSCQKLLDSSLNYPQSSGIVPFADSCSWRKPATSQDSRGANQNSQSTKINILSKIKVNRQSNTSLAVGPNAAPGLIIGHNTVKILKPTQSQQKLNNSLQKTSSFETNCVQNKGGNSAKANALLQQQKSQQNGAVPQGAGIKIKSSDIIRADFLAKTGNSNQSQLTRHSKKQLYQQLITQKLSSQGQAPILSGSKIVHQVTASGEKRSNTELMYQLSGTLNSNTKQINCSNKMPQKQGSQSATTGPGQSTKKIPAQFLRQGLVDDILLVAAQTDQPHDKHLKQAQTTKNMSNSSQKEQQQSATLSAQQFLSTGSMQVQVAAGQNANALASSINLKKPLSVVPSQPASSSKKQKESSQKLSSRIALQKPSASKLPKPSAMLATQSILANPQANNTVAADSREKTNMILSQRGVPPNCLTASVQPCQLTQSIINNSQKKIKGVGSRGLNTKSHNSRSSTTERQVLQKRDSSVTASITGNASIQPSQGSTTVLLDIDKLVRTSAAAAFLQSQNLPKPQKTGGGSTKKQASLRLSSQQPPVAATQALSRNIANPLQNLKQNTTDSAKASTNNNGNQLQQLAQPLIGKKKVVPATQTQTTQSFNPNATLPAFEY